ncbi:MAG: 3-phosphoshikimate 1-carboxyvinyltransferase [Caulobacteraceae bacterium]
MADEHAIARPSGPLKGRVQIPGDKSISHRALILSALAEGESEILGLLESADVLATLSAVRALGAEAIRVGEARWLVVGSGGFSEPAEIIDCGNSGTGARLLMGAVAGFDIACAFTGDASLIERPMMRVLRPLSAMGARWIGRKGGRLPIMLAGGGLKGIRYVVPEASAQVKSAILLAGLRAAGETVVIEKRATRDHTERMLAAFGVVVETVEADPETCEGGRVLRLAGAQRLLGTRIEAPADPSSAAFPLVAALVTPGSEVTCEGVLLNPSRTGLFETLIEMGADLSITGRREVGGEEAGDVTARASALRGVAVRAARAPSMIDEYPILAVAAAFASGATVMEGIRELRVKESDRLAAMAALLGENGVAVEAGEDRLEVVGGGNAPPGGGGIVKSHGDHRIAMSALILGLAAREPVATDGAAMIATSFPGFGELMRGLGADIAIEDGRT